MIEDSGGGIKNLPSMAEFGEAHCLYFEIVLRSDQSRNQSAGPPPSTGLQYSDHMLVTSWTSSSLIRHCSLSLRWLTLEDNSDPTRDLAL